MKSPTRQRRHGDAGIDPGRGEHLCHVPVAGHRHLVDKFVFKTERGQGPAFFVTMIVAELVLVYWRRSSSCGSRDSASSAPTAVVPAWPDART